MADTITIPATGSGTATPVVATDDAGASGHVQLVKLAISTDASAALIPAEAANGLDVDVTRVQGTVTADVTDSALRDLGKVDVASLDQYAPVAGRLPVDGSGVTQPVSAAALPLPAGAATEATLGGVLTITAHDAAFGTAGTPDAQVRSVQGIAGGTALPVSAASLPLPTGAATSALQLADGHNVTVDNASGAAAVNVQDGGNVLTVDGSVGVSSLPASTNTLEVVGDVASDVAIAGNPVTIGARASTAIPTAVNADNDAVNLWATRQGAQVVTMAPHVGIFGSQPWNLTSKTAQYTTTQTSAVLQAGGASERIVVTSIQIQAGGTVAGTLQVYFGTGAYARGTNLAIFDGEFAPSATLKPGCVMNGPFISAANGDDVLVTTSAAINPLTITVWFYVVT